MDKISIIFTHWHQNQFRSEVAKASIQSIFDTTKIPLEIVVVDNGGSIDDSRWFLDLTHEKKITHYLRNADNLHFCYAYNQAMKLVTGDYIVFMSNDIVFKEGWLEQCLAPLKETKEKFITSPLQYSTGIIVERYNKGIFDLNGLHYRLNMRAGSNCFMIRRADMLEVGEFPLHRIGGSYYTNKLVRKGFITAVTPVDMAEDVGFRKGFDLSKDFDFKKTLHNGEQLEVDLTIDK